jgi:hypothetical protein
MASSQFPIEIKSISASLKDSSLSAEGYYEGILKQVAEMMKGVPQEREAAVRGELLSAGKLVRELRSKDDFAGLRRAANQLFKAVQALVRPVPPVMPEQEIRRVWDALQGCGWASATIELLPARMALGEKIVGFDHEKLTTDRQMIVRQQLIDSSRPGSWTRLDTWAAQHQRPEILGSRAPVETTQGRRSRYAGF